MLYSICKASSVIPGFISNSFLDSGLASDPEPLVQNSYAVS